MPVTATTGTTSTVLIVDDDESGLAYLQARLTRDEFRTICARSVAEAKEKLLLTGIGSVDCVLADYRMPGEDGIDLLNWLQVEDPSLATVIITGAAEKSVVEASLRGGASDYLEKPVETARLRESVNRAVERTRFNRRLRTTRHEVQEAGRLSEEFPPLAVPESSEFFHCFRSTVSELGGDFLSYSGGGDRVGTFILGDVSGHDLRSAYISSYFQGFVRGLRGRNLGLADILLDFNSILASGWAKFTEGRDSELLMQPISLSVCAGEIDARDMNLRLINCGCPGIRLSTPDGNCETIDPEYSPLGWVPDARIEAARVDVADYGFVYCFSDGLVDYAARLEVDPFCLIYDLLSSRLSGSESDGVSAPDDLVVMRLQIDHASDGTKFYHPLIAEQYGGDELENIDAIQGVWQKSLVFALGDAVEARLLDMLLCCREAVLNGLTHGCGGASDKLCSLVLSHCPSKGVVRVRVDDAGHGHTFDPDARMADREVLDGSHLGLVLVNELSDRMHIENAGTSLVFEFDLARG